MAQYRAIFKRAYVKGIATAVLLTAGLAAGAAQAADTDIDAQLGATATEAKDYTVSGTATFSGSSSKYAGTLTVTGSEAKLSTDSSSGNVAQLYFKNLNVTNGATLELKKGESHTNGGFQGLYNDPDFSKADSRVTVDNATVTISGETSIQATNASLNRATLNLTGSKAGFSAEDGHNNSPVAGRGELSITNSTVNMSGTGVWMGGTFVDIADSKITLDGANSGGFARLYAYGTQGQMDLSDTTITVEDGKFGKLQAATLNLNDGTVVTNSGTLVLGSAGENNKVNLNDGAVVQINGTAKGHIYAASDINMTGGELTLVTTDGKFGLIGVSAPADYNAGTLGTFDTDLKATGGQITVTKSQIQMNNITLAGDVEVTLGSHIGDKDSYWTDNALINAEDNGNAGEGNLTINGATITMKAGSSIMGRTVNLNAGEISLNGTDDAYASGESGSAMFMAYGTSGVMNLAGGSIEIDAATEHGAIRAKDVNLTGTTITNAGTLTIAGVLDKTVSGANAVAESGGILFDMTGGSLTNNTGATLNLGVVSGSTAVDNKTSKFTIAGGNFTNAGTVNVASGSTLAFNGTATAAPVVKNTGTISVASGASFNTDGTVTIGSTTDAGTIKFTGTGSSGTFAGENVVLNNKIDIATGSTVQVEGNVTFNGDNSATNKVDLTGSGTLTLNAGSTLTINDAANTLGLTYTVANDSGSFTKGSGAASFSGAAGATLYLDVTGMTGLDGQKFDADGLTALKTSLTNAIGSGDYTVNFQGISIDLASGTISSSNTTDYSKVEDFLISGVETDELKNTSVAVTGSTEVQGSIGQVTTDGTNVIVADKTLTLNGHATTVGGEVASPVLTQTGTGTDATVAGVTWAVTPPH